MIAASARAMPTEDMPLSAQGRLTTLRDNSDQCETSSNAWLVLEMGQEQVVNRIRAQWPIWFAQQH